MSRGGVLVTGGSVGAAGEALARALLRAMSRGMRDGGAEPRHPRELRDAAMREGRHGGARDWRFRERRGVPPR